jgi:hypothetical protein
MAVSVVLAEAAVCGILVCVVARNTKLFRRETSADADFNGFPPALLDVPRRINE